MHHQGGLLMNRLTLCLSILVLLTLSGTALAETGSKKAQVVTEVTKLGGKVEFDETRVDKPIIKIDLHSTQVTEADLALLNEARKDLKELRYLDLRLTHIGDAGVAHLRNLDSLQTLNLFRTNLGDQGLARLKNLTQLQTLLIGGTKVTDAGLVYLKRFPQLKKLSLFQTQVTDLCIPYLRMLSNLEQLLISGTRITDAGAKELQRALPKLKFSEQT